MSDTQHVFKSYADIRKYLSVQSNVLNITASDLNSFSPPGEQSPTPQVSLIVYAFKQYTLNNNLEEQLHQNAKPMASNAVVPPPLYVFCEVTKPYDIEHQLSVHQSQVGNTKDKVQVPLLCFKIEARANALGFMELSIDAVHYPGIYLKRVDEKHSKKCVRTLPDNITSVTLTAAAYNEMAQRIAELEESLECVDS